MMTENEYTRSGMQQCSVNVYTRQYSDVQKGDYAHNEHVEKENE